MKKRFGNTQPFWPSILLFGGDALALAVAFWFGRIAHALYYGQNVVQVLLHWWGVAYSANLILFPLMSCIALLWFYYRGHYARQKAFWDELSEVSQVVSVLAVLNAAFAFSGRLPLSRLWLFSTWVLALILLPLLRMVMHAVISRNRHWQRTYVLLGDGANAAEAARAFASEPSLGYRLQTILLPAGVGEGGSGLPADVPRIPLGVDPLQTIAQLGNPHVVLALEMDQWQRMEELVWTLGLHYPNLSVAPPLRGLPLFGMETLHFFSHEVFILRGRDNLARPGPRVVKRLFDLFATSILLLLLSPLLLALIWRIRRDDGGPAFFVQERVGRGGRAFRCYKFRSMVLDAESRLLDFLSEHPETRAEYERNFKLREDPRVTRIGRFLRGGSLDELPQLFNVFKGEMSLVGPRPLLARELDRYGEGIFLYQQVRPGITGLWQTSGRSETTFAERASLDVWYVKNWSLWYDIVILLRTVKVVFWRDGAY
ncbi:Undecaprenyl-phosphate galactose phosphotransferase, WbaP [Acidithiobacillus ferrivorans SS3]|uniref:Undecaprenyl-phosphate galactose phosphotransferase, WbaP n=1 Tax=Acidithiobacillus ferrivorans SS3 TaxID=743299 RepID=G0JPC1_9PROT|nr:undecaprenyl-phosphate galactose phosphotransferase WbaP [Acidithiobacillus ferrivorans]AEM47352.1 Undecaprenyl-phosphate galactose phosphotransferase, WbaP [Acidithiobacillus ferrivorans SS3]